jgi:hypothetical protein
MLDAQLTASLARLGDPTAQTIVRGRAWGETVAQQILAWRANDGFSQVPTYTGSSAPGQWRHAPNATGAAAGLNYTVTLPFALTNLAAFDPGPPYGNNDRMAAMATAAYATDLNELKAKGGAVSLVRTPAQTNLALFINIADVTDINAIVRRAISPNARLVDTARTFALLNVVTFDVQLVVFNAKYKYGFWRPYQAIPFADEDGNPATVPDPAWVPLASSSIPLTLALTEKMKGRIGLCAFGGGLTFGACVVQTG